MVGKKIGVLIVDDSLLFRKKLEQSLSADPRIEIVARQWTRRRNEKN